MQKYFGRVLVALGVLSITAVAQAVTLNPDNGPNVNLSGATTDQGTLVTTVSGNFSSCPASLAGTLSGTWSGQLFKDGGGNYNMRYSISLDTGSAGINMVTTTNYISIGDVDVDFRTDLGGTVGPSVAAPVQNSGEATIHWVFGNGPSPTLNGGDTTMPFYVNTTVKGYAVGGGVLVVSYSNKVCQVTSSLPYPT